MIYWSVAFVLLAYFVTWFIISTVKIITDSLILLGD